MDINVDTTARQLTVKTVPEGAVQIRTFVNGVPTSRRSVSNLPLNIAFDDMLPDENITEALPMCHLLHVCAYDGKRREICREAVPDCDLRMSTAAIVARASPGPVVGPLVSGQRLVASTLHRSAVHHTTKNNGDEMPHASW